jgi:hypothetical protein
MERSETHPSRMIGMVGCISLYPPYMPFTLRQAQGERSIRTVRGELVEP